MRYINVSASDNRMDCRIAFHDPLNKLPIKCGTCGFPDLDHVPQPYVLVKSRTTSPNELALAENGNFFVRGRVRQVLELVAPGQCSFFETCCKGTTETTPWFLATANQQIPTGKVAEKIPRCEVCGEPRSAHPGGQWSEWIPIPDKIPFGPDETDCEVFVSSTWGSSERSHSVWISRGLYVSMRLHHLFKKIKAKGFDEATCDKPKAPNKQEMEWIKDKIKLIERSGIALHADGTLSDEDTKWFRNYLKTHAATELSDWDTKGIEKQKKVKLPKSYVDFIKQTGPTTFNDVDGQTGFTVSILPPNELDKTRFDEQLADEESRAVNPLTFATTEHGDSFCFDVQKGTKEYAVFHFKHEYSLLEPYAANFVSCIKRFCQDN